MIDNNSKSGNNNINVSANLGNYNSGKETFTGNRALAVEQPLLFEIGQTTISGVDVDVPETLSELRINNLKRREQPQWPGLSEPQAMRHYVRLSQKNYSIDTGIFPLGSCTMKHNPRQNERAARLPGFINTHPLQPLPTTKGTHRVITELATWLCELTGMPAIAMSPRAGAHGELCGMMAIKTALKHRNETRTKVLVPESAHGTNPATAALLGYEIVNVPSRDDETIDPEAVKQLLSEDIAAIMMTNPNTCGVFERDIMTITKAIHDIGGYFYCDGANLNAITGKVRPGDLGVDAMHINLHKTFSTPHGGGGPGAGPVVLSQKLAPFAPLPFWRQASDGSIAWVDKLGQTKNEEKPFGRLTAFWGQFGMFSRALSYMLAHGSDGLIKASEDAVINANYVAASVKDVMTMARDDGTSMHEAVFSDDFLKNTEISTLDFAKALIDEGFHPMTVYFPLVVHGAMLIEPTESESKVSLDLFIATLRDLAIAARSGDKKRFHDAPRFAPRNRLDETRAARNMILRYKKPQSQPVSY